MSRLRAGIGVSIGLAMIASALLIRLSSAQAATLYLGSQAAGGSTGNGDANYMNAVKATTGASGGTVSSMSASVASVSASPHNKYQMAIYTDKNGKPGTLVAKSASGTLTANSWNTIAISAALTANTSYWLTYNTNATSVGLNDLHYASGGHSAYSSGNTTFNTWPSSFGNSTALSLSYSIYATYTNSAPVQTAPVVSIASQPAAITAASTADFAFSAANPTDPSGTVTYQCALDGTAYADCTNPEAYSGLDLGSHSLSVTAKDTADGLTSAALTANWLIIDSTAPTVPAALDVTAISSTQVDLTWPASTDNVGVAGYNVYRDGTQIGATATNGFNDTSVAAGLTYSYSVSAYDAAGNVSAQTSPVPVTTTPSPIDTTAPSAPTNVSATAAANGQVDLSWTASTDDTAVAGYNVYRDGTLAATVTGTSYTDSAVTASTIYSYAVSAYDAAGNTSSQSSAAAVTTPAAAPDPDPVGQPAGQWNMKFDDEFNASSVTTVDQTNGLVQFGSGPLWKAWYADQLVAPDGNPHTNNPGTELEYYDPSALSVGSGLLTLTATHDNVHSSDGLPYTSGMIQSNPSFNAKYGYAEARIKAPAADGSWPAFWMLPSSYSWPPEIDIFENFSDPGYYKVSNWGTAASNWNNGATVFGKQVNTTIAAWHTYGLKWTPTTMVWYLDGRAVATETKSSSIPNENMYMVLNLAVRNADTQSFSTQVDYVRYWQ